MNDKPKTICAWCGKILREGAEPVSHGICQHCADAILAKEDAIREQCQCCMHHRWGSCKGLATDAKEFCESWEPMPSRDETFAGLAFIAAVLGMAAIVLYCLFT